MDIDDNVDWKMLVFSIVKMCSGLSINCCIPLSLKINFWLSYWNNWKYCKSTWEVKVIVAGNGESVSALNIWQIKKMCYTRQTCKKGKNLFKRKLGVKWTI